MPRALWPLRHGRPSIRVILTAAASGQPTPRFLVADTGAGSTHAPFELILSDGDCLLGGGRLGRAAVLRGAYAGSFPIYRLRVQVPELGFDGIVNTAGVLTTPVGFDGIAGFRFLNRYTYGNFGDPDQFGLET